MLSESFLLKQMEIKTTMRTPQVVQWIGICLPMKGTQGQPLVWGDSTGCRATKPCVITTEPECHESWNLRAAVHTLEPQVLSPCAESRAPQQQKPPQGEAQAPQPESSLCFLQLEKGCTATKTQCNQTTKQKQQNPQWDAIYTHQDGNNNKILKWKTMCWWGCGETGTLLHCWWECKMAQWLLKACCQFLKKLNTVSPYDLAISFLSTYPPKRIWTDPCMRIFTAALFTRIKMWK